MNTDHSELLSLPLAEQLRIVEMIWDNLAESPSGIPLPEWVEKEAACRRSERISDPSIGMTHEETWKIIEDRHG